MAVHIAKKRLLCPLCGRKMAKALTDTGPYQEVSLEGAIIEVVHVYYGCTNEECNTIIRLRFRKDGSKGDLFRMIEARRAGDGPEIVTEIPGKLSEIVGE